MTEEDLRKEVIQGAVVLQEGDVKEVVLQEGDVKEGAEITLKETVQVHRVIIDIFPYVKTTKSDSRCKFVEKRVFRHNEFDSRPSKKAKEKLWKTICWIDESCEAYGLRVPGFGAAEIQVDFGEEHKILGIKAQRAFLKRFASPRKNWGKRGSIARICSEMCEPHERSPENSKIRG